MIDFIKKYIDKRKHSKNKKYNILTDYQKNILQEQADVIIEIVKKEEEQRATSSKKYKNLHNNRCPNCRNVDSNKIIDKISRVIGKNELRGSLSGGVLTDNRGSVYGRFDSAITHVVNHCNVCGHQWKKDSINYKSDTEILSEYLQKAEWYWSDKSKDTWKDDVSIFNGLYAETFMLLIDKYNIPNYTLKFFREHNKSIHDD